MRPLAAGLLAALALAGCGEEIDEGYERAINDYFAEEIPATEAYEAEAEEAETLDDFADVLREGLAGSRRRFERFRAEAGPPDEIEAIHDDLVRTITQELRLGNQIAFAARRGDATLVGVLESNVDDVVDRFTALQQRFDDAGYDVALPTP